MHEAPIAQSILELVTGEAEKAKAKKVNKIYLKIGKMTGAVEDALRFYFEVLTRGTKLEEAEFEIEWVPTRAVCFQCQEVFEVEDMLPVCPHCSGLGGNIISGKELEVVKIEIER
jgi:hydrogenase nickel incorporation protein HypA/HybF